MEVTGANFWAAWLLRQCTRHYRVPQWPRERLCRLLFKPGQKSACPFSVPLDGIIYPGDLQVYQDWRVFFLGGFERETLNLLVHLLKTRKDPIFLDIGANKGLFSLVLARRCAAIHAFEPFPPIYQLLVDGLEMNGIINVTTHPVGLGAEPETMLFYPPGSFNIGTGSFLPEHQPETGIAPVPLRIERGDDYLAAFTRKVDVIKIDTEGFEGFVLAGLREMLQRNRPWIVFEVSRTTAQTFDAEQFHALFPEAYEFFLISDHTTCPTWQLSPIEAENLAANFGNILAAPREGHHEISHSVRRELSGRRAGA